MGLLSVRPGRSLTFQPSRVDAQLQPCGPLVEVLPLNVCDRFNTSACIPLRHLQSTTVSLPRKCKSWKIVTVEQTQGKCRRRKGPIAQAGTGEGAEVTSPHPAYGPYGPSNDLWLTQEVDRLTSMQRELPANGLLLTRGKWICERQEDSEILLMGRMCFHNLSQHRELFIPELSAEAQLLASDGLQGVVTHIQILPQHVGKYSVPARADGYWQAFILEAGKSTSIQARITIRSSNKHTSLRILQAVWFRVHYVCYGPHGRTRHTQHAILPLSFPPPDTATPQWRRAGPRAWVLPLRTHLLSHLDDPVAIFNMYVRPHARPGDVLAVGETPLAIMQGRYRHPSSLRVSWVARWACRFFHPTSSLATACGLQALVDLVGQLRVVAAVLLAGLARLARLRGMFYNLAGEQARLIDDVSGTLPPYDQFICLGPVRAQETVDALRARTGVDVAVVDVNDLRKCQILAASGGVDAKALTAALLDNPAGNADEQTPLVLVRWESERPMAAKLDNHAAGI